MARTTSVNQADVNAACFRLMADGLDPTFAAVYAELQRKGGKKNVLDAIANWRKSVARTYFAAQATPRYSVTEALRRFEELLATTLATPVIITRANRDAAVLLSATASERSCTTPSARAWGRKGCRRIQNRYPYEPSHSMLRKALPAAPRAKSASRRVAARHQLHFCLSRWDAAAQDWRPLEEGGRVRTYRTLQAAIRARAEDQHDTAIERHSGKVLVMRLLPPLPLSSLNAYREGRGGAIPRCRSGSREEIIARAREVFGDEAVMQIVNDTAARPWKTAGVFGSPTCSSFWITLSSTRPGPAHESHRHALRCALRGRRADAGRHRRTRDRSRQ